MPRPKQTTDRPDRDSRPRPSRCAQRGRGAFRGALLAMACVAPLAGQGDALELPRTGQRFAAQGATGPAQVLVVHRGGRPTWIRLAGAVDADGAVPLTADRWLPLGSLTSLVVDAALDAAEADGLARDATLAATVPELVAGRDAAFGALTWRELQQPGRTPGPLYERWLAAGEAPRSLDAVLDAHLFVHPRGGSRSGDLAAALLQRGLELRAGVDWAALVEGPVAERLGGLRLRARRPAAAPPLAVWWSEESLRGRWSDREVAAGCSAQIRAGDLARLAEALAVGPFASFGGNEYDPAAQAAAFGETIDGEPGTALRSRWGEIGGVDVLVRRYRVEPPLVVLGWSACAGSQGAHELADAAFAELAVRHPDLHPDRSLALGGGYGGRAFGREPPALAPGLRGQWRTAVPQLDGTAVACVLQVNGEDPGAVDLAWGGDRLAALGTGRDRQLQVDGHDGERKLVTLALELGPRGLHGVATTSPDGRSSLPWRVRFERVSEPVDWTPSLRGALARLDLHSLLTADGESTPATGRLLAVARGGESAIVAVGPADPARGEPALAGDDPLPLGGLSMIAAGVGLLELAERGRVALGEPIAQYWPADESFADALRGLDWHDLLMPGSLGAGYFRRIDDESERRPLHRVLQAHAFVRPEWLAGDPRDELGVAMLQGTFIRAGIVPDWAAFVAGDLDGWLGTGLRVVTTRQEAAASPLRCVGGDGVAHAAWLGEVEAAACVWGSAADALVLGRAVLRHGGESWPGGVWESAERWPRLRWLRFSDDSGDAVRQLTVVPALELVIFAFGNGGGADAGLLATAERRILAAFEPPGPVQSWFTADEFEGPAGFDGTWAGVVVAGERGARELSIELAGDPGSATLRLDGRELTAELSFPSDDVARIRAATGDGDEVLLFALRRRWFGTQLRGVVWSLQQGRSALPSPLTLARAAR
ncbi:MAG: hypothetical protein IPM29_12060 [Planctomycetes bacterium]|nr:hypothetical protein [Planctomycetota bacterium]